MCSSTVKGSSFSHKASFSSQLRDSKKEAQFPDNSRGSSAPFSIPVGPSTPFIDVQLSSFTENLFSTKDNSLVKTSLLALESILFTLLLSL